ncbi:MAG: transglutaminase family protein [Solirubrobacteraceae bacterium]
MSEIVAYRVTHRTEYEYESDVSASYGQLHLLPRDLPGQRCRTTEVLSDPVATDYRERIDYFGNRACFLAIHEPHRALSLTVSSLVEVDRVAAECSRLGHRPWEQARDAAVRGDALQTLAAAEFRLDSPLVQAGEMYCNYAASSFAPGRDLLDALRSLSARIHNDFAYQPGTTSVTTPLAEVFGHRRGVCQDFAHLAIACLRSLGLPARYVSGYLETDAPPGAVKLTGVDGSHAWLSVLVPDAGWIDIDPTNDQFPNSRYIVTAYGRDYSDVPPLNGVIYTEGRTTSLKVAVDVVAVAD